ncbi:hypothetical protein [Alkaliflexus imshenetskii]|uniref:hypothetical protein n=1 Tax=Alkaliflexus imshenetskii TaxID=286730 RepID=UPI00047E56EF|nr:hypothetical protein [Alkaliflexus imshenetskii]
MKTQVIGGIILLVIAGLFAKYKIFDEKIELKFSLSEKIPSDFIDNIEGAGIQQLTVKNSGDVLISSIVIKIDANIQELRINKFKSTDSVTISKTNNYTEILYPEIPPSGEVIILLKLLGNSINNDRIEIIHSKGTAHEAFSDRKSYGNTIFLVISFIYLIVTFFGLRGSLVDSLESRAKYSPLEILKRNKPWYVKDTKWHEIRETAISNYIEKDYVSTIEKSDSYQLLNTEKKYFLSEDEWLVLLDKAEKKILLKITEKIYQSFYDLNFEELSNLKKPINISYENWKKINEEISKAYCMHKIRDTLRFGRYSVKDILNSKKPDIVTYDDWTNLKEVLSTFYASIIIEEGIGRLSYEKYIDKVNLDILDTSRKTMLEDLFKNIGEGYELKENYRQLLQAFNEMFYWNEIPNKPDYIEPEEWKKIEELFNRVIKKEKEADANLSEANKLKTEYMPLKEKVTKQLEIIDNLLIDPASIEKVEVYNNPFAKGNWENIQKIYKLLINK